MPKCDFCKMLGKDTEALYDAKSLMGPWAYFCEAHLVTHGTSNTQLINKLKKE